jgi:hypothetical protein
MIQAMHRGPGWKSWTLFLHETKLLGTADDIRWLCAWSMAYNARMDEILGPWRHSNNAWIMGIRARYDGTTYYYHKRQSWQSGQFWSNTMEEAIRFACEAVH